MIPNFPRPYPDELLYSLIARQAWLQQSSSLRSFARRIFATDHALAVVDLPARIGSLLAAIGDNSGLQVQTLIRNHTLLGAYAPFIPPHRLAQIENDLAGNGGGAVHLRAGIMASRVQPPSHLRFCPRCAAEERAKTGEAYWHRLHQLACVFICPVHRVFLEPSTARAQFRRTRHEFIPAEDVIPEAVGIEIDEANPEHQTLLRIAQGADWLLRNYCPGTDLVALQQRYRQQAMKRGFMTGAGSIHWADLLEAFRNHFPDPLLAKLSCSLDASCSDHWLARILRQPRVVQSPIRHLVLMDFFGLSPEAFFALDGSTTLFGPGPWPCENPVCPSSGQLTITEVHHEHSHEHRRPLGLFQCPVCGQIRCRVSTGDRQIVWVRDFGPLWNAELAKLWTTPEVSLRGLAKRLGVDPMTVKRYATNAGLAFPRMGRRVTGKNGPTRTTKSLQRPDVSLRRAEWLELRALYPLGSILALRHRAPGCYAYLYRHDRDWLRSHCPARQIPTKPASRVDWHARDLRLAQKVGRTKELLLQESARPTRISWSALARQLGVPWLRPGTTKLPLTITMLAAAAETQGALGSGELIGSARDRQWQDHFPKNANVIFESKRIFSKNEKRLQKFQPGTDPESYNGGK